jgi:hypothetical protein
MIAYNILVNIIITEGKSESIEMVRHSKKLLVLKA